MSWKQKIEQFRNEFISETPEINQSQILEKVNMEHPSLRDNENYSRKYILVAAFNILLILLIAPFIILGLNHDKLENTDDYEKDDAENLPNVDQSYNQELISKGAINLVALISNNNQFNVSENDSSLIVTEKLSFLSNYLSVFELFTGNTSDISLSKVNNYYVYKNLNHDTLGFLIDYENDNLLKVNHQSQNYFLTLEITNNGYLLYTSINNYQFTVTFSDNSRYQFMVYENKFLREKSELKYTNLDGNITAELTKLEPIISTSFKGNIEEDKSLHITYEVTPNIESPINSSEQNNPEIIEENGSMIIEKEQDTYGVIINNNIYVTISK